MIKQLESYQGGTSESDKKYPAPDMSKWTVDNLQTVALKRGIDIAPSRDRKLNAMQKRSWLVDKITNDVVFTQTDPELCRYLASMSRDHLPKSRCRVSSKPLRIADFGAGHGSITAALRREYPDAHIDVFELESRCSRINAAKHMYSEMNINWYFEDVLTEQFLKAHQGQYDVVAYNPPFKLAFSFMYVALQCLKPDGYCGHFARRYLEIQDSIEMYADDQVQPD